jgi:hypothetical protein
LSPFDSYSVNIPPRGHEWLHTVTIFLSPATTTIKYQNM